MRQREAGESGCTDAETDDIVDERRSNLSSRIAGWGSRRQFLAAGATAVGIGLAGCLGGDGEATYERNYDGPGVSPEGTDWEELPDLHGELTVYSGRREAQIGPVLTEIESYYDDLTINVRYEDNETHLRAIDEEGENSPADVLYTQDSGTLGALKALGRTVDLTDDILETVPGSWRDPEGTWTGVSGRTRCIAYNTDTWDAGDLPTDLFAYPEADRFHGEMGWRVDSGSFLGFVRAMMVENGDDRTRQFLEDMLAADVNNYEGGSTTPNALADGEVSIGLVNHYYVGRLIADQPDAPVSITFTEGDVGSLFNVSGAAVLDSSDERELGQDFIRHLLGRQGQEFFVDTNKEYAVIDGVDYVGDLPTLEDLNPPEFDLNELADIEPAVDLLRDVGMR
ncbi:ABC-type Fe3+ transport system, periplasmic component [Halalkaliarchaeum sp. AArc-CO]|uniref:substrate-binding domain-containing protein n=1 Tax=unclassified Halalkaliarchaeum TaxID=2678344 RepID=UPI00217CC632|nr:MULTISPECIES: substrate-binding domain-containing protein [unclassified Halalkaliarchaeum]MDR5672481.1 substrate-binding domain-containing protein [Halalkaliarchaeum sp. AArc-GB]UWG50569.1 ABC-type Fe3+ transport system, periplasmic component [Halalkaliarchaeum sp. AArc-CO]